MEFAWNSRKATSKKKECSCHKCSTEKPEQISKKPCRQKTVIGAKDYEANPKLFSPEDQHAFMYKGSFPEVQVALEPLLKVNPSLVEEVVSLKKQYQPLKNRIKMIQVTGCGLEETTLVFNLLQEMLSGPSVSLDEPRLLYCLQPNQLGKKSQIYSYDPSCWSDSWSILSTLELHKAQKLNHNQVSCPYHWEGVDHLKRSKVQNYFNLVKFILTAEALKEDRQPLDEMVYLERMPQTGLRPNVSEEMAHYFDLTVVGVERCWIDVALGISEQCLQDWFGFNSRNYICIIYLLGDMLQRQNHEGTDETLLDFVKEEYRRRKTAGGSVEDMFRKGLLEWLAFQLVKDHHKEDAAYRRVSVRYEHLAEGQAAELLEPVFKAAGREMKGQPTTAVRPLNKAAFEERNSRLKAVMQGAAPSGELEQHVFDIFANEKTRIFTPGSKQYDVFLNGL